MTTTPLRPPGTSSLARGSSPRVERYAAPTRTQASATRAARTAPVRIRARRSARASGVGIVRDLLRRPTVRPPCDVVAVLPRSLELGEHVGEPDAKVGGERPRAIDRGVDRRPGELPCADGEPLVAEMLHLVRDELERPPALLDAVAGVVG